MDSVFYRKLVDVLGMIIATWGFLKWPSWGPWGAIALGFTALIDWVKLEKQQAHKISKSDIQLFETLLTDLQTEIVINAVEPFLTGWSAWDNKRIKELQRFLYNWKDAEHEFVDPVIEKRRKRLFRSIYEFDEFYAYNTYPHETRMHFQEIPGEWEAKQPERFRKVHSTLRKFARKILYDHQNLIRTAMKRLSK